MNQPNEDPGARETVEADASAAVARRYSEALVNAAERDGGVDAALGELAEIQRDVLKAHPRLAEILASARITPAKKDKLLLDVFEKRSSSLVLRFLRVLNRHDRLNVLDLVVREARAIWDRRNRRVPVQVRAARPLAEDQLKELESRLARLTGATPVLHVATDPDLIGGLVVQVGDNRYDASVKSRLAQLRQRLIEGRTHEIQSRRDQFSHPA
jgi:F-type H+-transporting ATPase subunit delta